MVSLRSRNSEGAQNPDGGQDVKSMDKMEAPCCACFLKQKNVHVGRDFLFRLFSRNIA